MRHALVSLLGSLLVISSIIFTAGCEKQGPAEQAGEQIDEAVEEAKQNVEEAVEEGGEKLEEAGETLQNQ